jgi:hypothetical protein
MEVRRARVPLLPARCRPRHRRPSFRRSAPRLAPDAPAAMVGCGSRRPPRRRSGWRFCRRRARRAGVPGRRDHRQSRSLDVRTRVTARRRRDTGDLVRHRQSTEYGARRLAGHRRHRLRYAVSGTRDWGSGTRDWGSGIRGWGPGTRNAGFGSRDRRPRAQCEDGQRIREAGVARPGPRRPHPHTPAPQRPRIRCTIDSPARHIPVHAGAPPSIGSALGRHRLATAYQPAHLRPSRGGPRAGTLRISARPGGCGRVARGHAPGISLGGDQDGGRPG